MSLVRRPDHVVCLSVYAEEMFRHLTNRCGLPEAWPFADYGGYVSGGVGCGNLNLEFVQVLNDAMTTSRATFIGVSFEPNGTLEDLTLSELDDIGQGHGDLARTPGWTTLALHGLHDTMNVFFCDYYIRGARDDAARADALRSAGGGTYQVLRAGTVTVGVDQSSQEEKWSRLLGPSVLNDRLQWDFSSGPSLCLAPKGEVSCQVNLVLRSVEDVESWRRTRQGSDPLHGLALNAVVDVTT